MKWYPSDPSGACVRVNGNGKSFEEFSCLYPTYGRTYFEFERNFDPIYGQAWMKDRPWLPILAVALYGAFIVGGRAYFEKRPAWNLRGALALWNLGLSLFSAWGFLRVAPYVIHNFRTYTWRENFCMDPEHGVGSGSSGLFCMLFTMSKFPELFDTFFIVVHKKKLLFLHWYHHVSVLVFTWAAYVYNSPTGAYYCSMNYFVHAIMYFYYFLMAVHAKPKWFKAQWITVLQILQMVMGVIITGIGCYILYVEKPEECWLSENNNTAALIMYGSYLFLFMEFFFMRYAVKSKVKHSQTPIKKRV